MEWNGTEKELSGGEAQTTNNRMELTAVISALRALKEPCEVSLYTDSKYVCDAVQKRWVYGWRARGWIKADKKPALNVDLWQELLPLLETHRVSWNWVKGHADNAKNNRCDELAVAQSPGARPARNGGRTHVLRYSGRPCGRDRRAGPVDEVADGDAHSEHERLGRREGPFRAFSTSRTSRTPARRGRCSKGRRGCSCW